MERSPPISGFIPLSSSVPMPAPLTPLEVEILDFIVGYLRAHTFQPSIREIGERFGIPSTKTVAEHLGALAEKGYLERDPSRARGVRVRGLDLDPDLRALPLYSSLPDATATRDDGEEILSMDRRMVPFEGGYLVRASTEWLRFGIEEGDLLLLRPEGTLPAVEGSLVSLLLGGVPRLFRVLREGEGIALLPSDRGAPPLRVEDPRGLAILGRVAAIHRTLPQEDAASLRPQPAVPAPASPLAP